MNEPELRTDIVSGARVVVAPARGTRPGAWPDLHPPDPAASKASCPFCEGREAETPAELHAAASRGRAPDAGGWQVRVVPNKFPSLGAAREVASEPPFKAEAAAGSQDVVIHTPNHLVSVAELSEDELGRVAEAWQWRGATSPPPERVYTHVAINEGIDAGASLEHTHSQIFSLPFVPPWLARELECAGGASACAVCALVAAERQSGRRVVADDGEVVVYCPHASRFPYETVVAPARCERDAFSSERLAPALREVAAILRRLRGSLGWVPVNIWLTTSPADRSSTHWRLTIAPRLTRAAGLELGTELLVNPVAPEDAAALLR